MIVVVAGLFAATCRPYYNPGFVPRLGPVVAWKKLRVIEHDTSSFTQGLAFAGGYLYESAGGFGESRVMKVDATTGRIVAERGWPPAIIGTLPSPFAEGLAVHEDMLVQLSWKNGRALTWSRTDLRRGKDLPYSGEGWGLCFDGTGYWRSDGSARVHRHAVSSFAEEPARMLTVTSRGVEVTQLNELECVGEYVLANVWHTAYVVIIHARDGAVVGALDFTALIHDVDASGRESVLNGLAWDPTSKELYVTGKRWGKTFVVEISGLR